MFQGAVERAIRRLKSDRAYAFEGTYSLRELVAISRPRLTQLLRGQLLSLRVSADRPLFAGRRITIRNGRKIRIGRSSIIGDDVILDGLAVDGLRIGANVTIGRGCTLLSSGVVARRGIGLVIGDRTGISEYCHLAGQGGLTIGSDVLFGPGVRVFTENHRFDRPDQVIRLQGEERMPVVIEDGCWIGGSAVILAGVRIGAGAVVGAGSVVTADVPAGAIVVGNPARVVRKRSDGQRAAESERPTAPPSSPAPS
jgi:acetyltransferase-like isoleucine patch superfamily enzyme